MGVWVDAVHSLTALGLAAVDRSRVRAGLTDTAVAALWAVAGYRDLAGARPAPAYAAPPPPPVVVYEEPEPICHRERRPLFDEYGRVAGYRMVRVCE